MLGVWWMPFIPSASLDSVYTLDEYQWIPRPTFGDSIGQDTKHAALIQCVLSLPQEQQDQCMRLLFQMVLGTCISGIASGVFGLDSQNSDAIAVHSLLDLPKWLVDVQLNRYAM
jgi:hypothetical protein